MSMLIPDGFFELLQPVPVFWTSSLNQWFCFEGVEKKHNIFKSSWAQLRPTRIFEETNGQDQDKSESKYQWVQDDRKKKKTSRVWTPAEYVLESSLLEFIVIKKQRINSTTSRASQFHSWLRGNSYSFLLASKCVSFKQHFASIIIAR